MSRLFHNLVILDYSDGSIYLHNVDAAVVENKDFEIQDVYNELNELHDLHLKESQCEWMHSDELSVDHL